MAKYIGACYYVGAWAYSFKTLMDMSLTDTNGHQVSYPKKCVITAGLSAFAPVTVIPVIGTVFIISRIKPEHDGVLIRWKDDCDGNLRIQYGLRD